MSTSDESIDALANQTQSSLSLSSTSGHLSQDSTATSSSGSSPLNSSEANSSSPNSSSPSLNSPRQFHGIGSGSGGPPSRANNIGTGGPSSRSGPSPGPNSVNVATGGPGSRTRANEMTRQLASTRLPPSLQARLAAVSLLFVAIR